MGKMPKWRSEKGEGEGEARQILSGKGNPACRDSNYFIQKKKRQPQAPEEEGTQGRTPPRFGESKGKRKKGGDC